MRDILLEVEGKVSKLDNVGETLTARMILVLLLGKMHNVCVLFTAVCLLLQADISCGMTVTGEGGVATERTTDIKLSCDAKGLNSDDELIRVTWYVMDQSHHVVSEIFSADLTNDQPAFIFSFNWAGRGMLYSGSLANIRLPSRYVTREYSGNYRCQVNSLMSSGFVDVNITVLYGPGSSVFISPGGRVVRQEGEELTLTCSSQCNPVCTYRWYKAGRQVSSSTVLTMSQLTRDKAGLYACQARNDAGRSIKPVDLRISYPATILGINTSGAAVDSSTKTKNKVESNEDVVFTCKVKGWPEPSIDWIKNSPLYVSIRNTSFVTTQLDIEIKSSRFEIKSATCRDNGEYICKAWNNIGIPTSKSVTLNLSCSPFETKHLKLCHQGNDVSFIRNLQENVSLKMCFYGNPIPNVTLTHIQEKRDAIKTYIGNTTCDLKMNQCESSIEFIITSPDQYGLYKAKVENKDGHFEKRFYVSSQQPPLLPSTFLVVNISQNSACFTWKSNFNGGSKQTFSLRIYTLIKGNEINYEKDQSKEKNIEEDESRFGTEDVFEYSLCVTDLTPSTRYEAVLSSSNKFGLSESSRRDRFTTKTSVDSTIPIPSWLSVAQVSTKPRIVGTTLGPKSKGTQAPIERIARVKEQTTKKSHVSLNKDLNSSFVTDDKDEDNDDNETEMSDLDDSYNKKLSHYLDAYLSLKKNDSLISAIEGEKIAKLSSKYDSQLQRIFFNYATAQSQSFKPESMIDPDPSNVLEDGITSSVFHPGTPLTTLPVKPVAASPSMYPLTVSTVLVGTSCVLGIAISLGIIAFIKGKHSEQCPQECSQRNDSTGAQPHNEGSIQPQSTQQEASNRNVFNNGPSITSVYNQNASFSPPRVKRPRLSTPNKRLFRTKETSSSSVSPIVHPSSNIDFLQHDLANLVLHYEVPTTLKREEVPTTFHSGCSTSVNRNISVSLRSDASTSLHHDLPSSLHHNLPMITFENSRGSCPSYLELHHPEKELPHQTCDIGQSCQPTVTLQLEQPQYLIPVNNRLSFVSNHQTDLKTLDDHESDFSTSYLDLYETLTSRSRSRSPSNIYDPFLSEGTESSGQCIPLDHNDSKKREECSVDSLKDVSKSNTRSEENKTITDVSKAQEGIGRVKLRAKNIHQRLIKKLTNPGNIKDTHTIPDGPYELIDPVSRKHLASRVCLPKTSTLNLASFLSDNFPNAKTDVSTNLQSTNLPPSSSDRQISNSLRKFPKSEDNKYEYCIPLENGEKNQVQNSIIDLSHKKCNVTHQDNFSNKIAEAFANESNFLQRDKQSRIDAVKNNSQNLKAKIEGTCPQLNIDTADISEIHDYVEEYTISAMVRNSVDGMSHGYCSIYSNEDVVRNSVQSNFSNEHLKSFRSGCCCSTEARIAFRDSGVSCSYSHDNRSYKSDQIELKNSTRKRLCDPKVCTAGSSKNDKVLYEEPIVPEHIYTEVSH